MVRAGELIKGLGGGLLATKSGQQGAKDILFGTPETRENVSTLRPEQEGLYQQLVNSGMQTGAGGAFGTAADYYRSNLGNNPADYNAFAAPQMRQFNEQIIPDISEQFAGMGAGGLSSSGFRNAAVGAGTDLSERLGAIRANLRHSSAQGLQNIGQLGLGNFSQNMVTQPGSQGLLSQIGPAAASAAGAYIGGPAGAQIGSQIGGGLAEFGNRLPNYLPGNNKVGANTGPYGAGGPKASPTIGGSGPTSRPSFNNVQF